MTADAWLTLGVVVGAVALLATTALSPALVLFGAVIVLLALGVLDVGEALSGFSNPAPFAVAALYVLAAAVQATGGLTPLLQRALGPTAGYRRPLVRVLPAVAAASAFLNNTPVVAMLVPDVSTWARARNLSVSRLLMPVSFAAIVGGMCTLIGTSTNLVVAGQMERSGLAPMGFFEIAAVGLPIALLGLVLLVVLGPRALPERQAAASGLAQARRFSVEMVVCPGGPVDGRSVEQAGLRHLAGVFLTSLDRGDSVVAPVRPDTVLRGGNRLRFVGQVGTIVDLQATRGLEPADLDQVLDLHDPHVSYVQVVVGSQSPVVGRTLAEVGFRSRYHAAVLAIHRAGQLVEGKLGTVRLRVGDTLLVVADHGFEQRWRDKPDFLLVAGTDGTPPAPASRRAWLPLTVLAATVAAAASGLVDIVVAALVGAVLLVLTSVLTPAEARRAVDLEVVVVIASAFGLASAVQASGLAALLADGLVDVTSGWGARGTLLGLVLATIALTEVVTNNAAALLMVPIATAGAAAGALDPRGAAIAVAVAASASFLTPVGYQTNTMIYGPGGYRLGDYARLGLPLTALTVALLVALVPLVWPA